jgi:sec-independent protein translocase protein TatB
MFEVGFTEILVIFVIALVVLGPEKLPRLARQAGNWMGRARAMARQLRSQLDEEVDLAQSMRPTPAARAPAPPPPQTPAAPPTSHE